MSKLTFVKYPSNQNFLLGARIVVLGGDKQWRDQFISQVNELWIDEDVNFFFIEDTEKMEAERTSWIMNQIALCDFFVIYVEDKKDTNTLLNLGFAGVNIDNPNCFVLFDETDDLNIVQNLYATYNKNNFCETESEVIVAMREMYADATGYNLVDGEE